MDIIAVKQLILQVLNETQIFENEPMKNHTSFKVGGNADFLLQPNSIDQLAKLIGILKDVPYFIMGNGTNLIVSDSGYHGVIIKICGAMSRITVEDDVIIAEGGALLSRIASTALNEGLGGLEFAAGIPGTLGGAIVMNAGAYGGEISQVAVSTEFIDENGEINELTDHEFAYRTSVFTGEKYVIAKSKLKLFKKDKAEIKAEMAKLSKQRREKQPLEYPSAGSAFKRPDGFYAGKLIQDAGLSGYSIGGAMVSEKHCGFIINSGNATCQNIIDLIEYIQGKVYEQFGVELEPEIKILR